jgi:hypothetical protein
VEATAGDAGLQQPRGCPPGAAPTARELARLLAHDLRTPLNALRGFTDLLVGGGAGPLPTAALEFLGEIALAGRALEAAAELAQEVAEPPPPAEGFGAAVDLGEMLDGCGFRIATCPAVEGRQLAVGGDRAGWRRLLMVCRAHLSGSSPEGPRLWASAVLAGHDRLELRLGRTELRDEWQMSVLREYLLRRLAAAQEAVVASDAPHLPLLLSLRRREGRGGSGSRGGSFFP